MDTDTQDGKDRGEKEAETYENVFEYLTKGCYPQGASKAEKSVLRRMSILDFELELWMGSSITMEKRDS